MRLRVGFSLPWALILTVFFSATSAFSQDPAGGAAQQTLPLGPHEYVGGVNDIVNPATGGLSLRFQIPLPPGRGLNIPFSINYDTNGIWHTQPYMGYAYYDALSQMYENYGVLYLIYKNFIGNGQTNNPPWSLGGWSYPIPQYSVIDNDDVGNPNDAWCLWASDFQFYDPSGGQHPLQLGVVSDPDTCNYIASIQGHAPPQNYSTGGDNQFRAGFPLYSAGGLTPTVVGLDGTSYTFTAAIGTLASSVQGQTASTHYGLASQIEDRNGNLISIAQNGTAVTYQDTLGRNILNISSFASPTDTINVSGNSSPYQVKWINVGAGNPAANFTSVGDFCQNNNSNLSSEPGSVESVSAISMPNGDTYTFSYDPVYGLINKITYPTGAWISYKWGANAQSIQTSYTNYALVGTTIHNDSTCYTRYDTPAVQERDVSYDGTTIALKQTFSYLTTWGGVSANYSWTNKTTTVTDTDLIANSSSVTTYTYIPSQAPIDPNTAGYVVEGPDVPVESTVQYGNQLTKTENGEGDHKICEVDTVNGVSYGTFTTYKPYSSGSTSFLGGPNEIRVYDYGSVSPSDCLNFRQMTVAQGYPVSANWPQANALTDTTITYQAFSWGGTPGVPSTFEAANLLPLPIFPSNVTVTGTGGNESITNYVYDASPLTTTPGVTAHDEAHYASNILGPRGNVTSISRTIAAGHLYANTAFTYDETGNQTSSTDANGNQTQFIYSSQWAYAYPSQIVSPTTNGVNHIKTFQYDNSTGHLLEVVDENSQPTDYEYDDPLGRLTSVEGSTVNGQRPTTQFVYVDGSSPSMTVTDPMGVKSQVAYDGFGRSTLSTLLSDPQGAIYSRTIYDGEGNLYHKWNPTRCNPATATSCPNETTFGATTYSYDQLHRITGVSNADGTESSTSYNANARYVTDEDNNVHKYVTNVVGALTSVVEPGSLTTSYSYDALNNLITVDQQGDSANGETPILRSFTYDSLSRLSKSENPETGEIDYSYDPNGNILQKTDARGIITNYSYDQLNRLITKTYSDGTPSVSFAYDTSTIPESTNTIGRLTSETVAAGSTIISQRLPYAYDPNGRINQLMECTPANCAGTYYHLAYGYDLAGDIVNSTNGVPVVSFTGNPTNISSYYGSNATSFDGITAPSILLTTTYDEAGRPSQITSSWSDATNHPSVLFQAASTNSAVPAYGPAGLLNAVLGYNSQSLQAVANMARTYDNRLRLTSEIDTGIGTVIVPATTSAGSITISGLEQQTTTSATPATGTITVTGVEGSRCLTEDVAQQGVSPNSIEQPPGGCTKIYDSGELSVVVNNFTVSVSYGALSTDTTLATALVQAFGTVANPVSGSPVTATSNGSVVTLTSVATGASANYPISITKGADFSATASPTSLAGGAAGTITYDTGAVSVLFNGTSFTVPWQAGSTAQSIANELYNSIHYVEPYFKITLSDTTINLVSTQTGAAANLGINCTAPDSGSETPSFNVACSGMSGGTNAYAPPLQLYSYIIPQGGGYAPNGNLLNVTDSVTGNWTYGYDHLNRLTQAMANSGTYMGANIAGVTLGWSYDSFGNRLTQNSTSAIFPTGSTQYGTNNQATGIGLVSMPTLSQSTLQYDAAGDLTGTNGVTTQAYDAEGRLCAVSNGTGGYTQYIYDAEGNRVAKGSVGSLSCAIASNGFTPTSSYVIDVDGKQITEIDMQSGAWSWLHSNVFAGGQLLATYNGSDTYFAFHDWLGSKRIEVTPDGLLSSFTSLPFGDGLASSGPAPDATEHHFTGKERDAESGLDYFGARYYGSNMGRFMSPDPSGLYFADPTNPQSLNLYSYALNNPLKNTDPTGMYCYYGDTGGGAQEDADLQDDSQFDYHSSQSECETADENGNKGQWINDAGTSQDANGNWVDNADRQPGYMEAATQPSSNQQSSQFDWSKLIPQATFQVGLSLNLGILGPITATGFTGFVFDTHGHVGTYRGGGGGASLGAGVSGGLQLGVSDGRSICAVGGPFVNASVTGGAGVAGTVDVFGGKGDGPGGVVVGDGGTIGIGGGADASVMVTGTTVKPFGNHQCSDGKIQ